MTETEICDYWEYYPDKFSELDVKDINQELQHFVEEYTIIVPWTGKEYSARRLSCVFYQHEIKKGKNDIADKRYAGAFKYDGLPYHDWSESSIMTMLKDEITKIDGRSPAYCLVHFYRDGHDKIDYHNDKESLNEVVYSISFGCPRKFRFRKHGETKGYDKEFILSHGDLLIMKKGCQQVYVHCVPTEAKVKDLRINMTFRYK